MSSSPQGPSLNRIETLSRASCEQQGPHPGLGTAVLDIDVYVLGATAGPIQDGKPLEEDTQINLVTLDTANGPIIPFFSSDVVMNMVLAHDPSSERRHLRLQGRILSETTRGHRLVLNPDRPHGKVFTPAEAATLLADSSTA